MTIAFDFDGVIHQYSEGWKDGSIYDPISTEWINLVRELLSEGHGIFILSTRSKQQIYSHMKKMYYCGGPTFLGLYGNYWKFGFSFRKMNPWEKFYKTKKIDGCLSVGICNHKAIFDILIDDRALCFTGNYEGLKQKIKSFVPWGDKQ